MSGVNAFLEPGMFVLSPDNPDWGLGQIQSKIGERVTINFEHSGKIVLIGSTVALELVFDI